MKKLMLLIIAALCVNAASAMNDKLIKIEQLPAKAQEFIRSHFSKHTVKVVKQDTDFADNNYEVIFSDGSSVEFNKKGNWTDVECKTGSVPASIIPTAIIEEAKTRDPQARIIKIDKDRNGYEIKLSSGSELEFNSKLQLIDLD